MADETLGPETACFKNEDRGKSTAQSSQKRRGKTCQSTNDKHIRRPFDAILIRALFLTWSLESLF